MSQTVTVRLTKDLAEWLAQTARQRGVSHSRVIREQLEKARAGSPNKPFMALAGSVDGARNLSQRKGFSGQ